jgi:hypothetical protein
MFASRSCPPEGAGYEDVAEGVMEAMVHCGQFSRFAGGGGFA